ncbi:Aimp1 [Scenedesmus sp. PABB004]|nr:Aimp1 [Scenedesmus sp. PABB004]
MSAKLGAPEGAPGATARLVARYAGVEVDEQAGAAVVQLELGGEVVAGLVPVAQSLARASAQAEQLLGATPSEKAQVLEWLTHATTELSAVSDEALARLNAHLEPRTFLAGGTHLTLADLVAFGLVHDAVAALPGAQAGAFTNLLRWLDLLQHTADAGGEFARVPIVLPAFVPPPPPPSAERASKAGSAAPSGGSQAAAGGKKADKAAKGGDDKAAAKGGDKAAAKGDKAAAAPSSSSSSSAATTAAVAAVGAAAAGAAAGAAAAVEAGSKKKEGKKDKAAAAAAGGGGKQKEAEEARIDMLDIRVGTIVSVQQHPNADALYLEEIDVGEDKPRQIISGLVRFVPLEAMQGRRVVVVTNLKPAKMRDVMSYGMVLCASNDAHDAVDPITPPEGVPNGERVTFEGFGGAPLEEVNPKRKILERLFPDLTTNAGELKAAFYAFASFGSSQRAVDMEGKNFIKLCKDAKLLCKALTTTDVDLLFAKVKAKGARKITFPEFMRALDGGCSLAEVVAVVTGCGGPQDSGTKAEAVKWHDDKSLYTGVYGKGGPTNVDMDPTNLAGLCDRSSADVRGVKHAPGSGAGSRRTTGDGRIPAARCSTGEAPAAPAPAGGRRSTSEGIKNLRL